MATNLADLRVGLLLNDASFRSNITGALNHAGRETERFSNKAKRETKAVADGFLFNQSSSDECCRTTGDVRWSEFIHW